MSVARLSLPFVVSPERLPTSCPVQDDSRVPIWWWCSNAITRFGNKALDVHHLEPRPGEGHRWIATYRRDSFFRSMLIAGGIQPRLCRLERHRLLARKAELGAVPPHALMGLAPDQEQAVHRYRKAAAKGHEDAPTVLDDYFQRRDK